ncbi:MAG: hypothetical protein WBH20_10400, partial [Oceanisphaera sp.]|uniref:hypothetical protein n=1 Tax=Oceanisphaera sp. TaxID=1929979 RepID=UPI003C7601BA
YGFLQTPPLASDALAIQIIFPLVRVIRLLSAYRVCQLCWANKNAAPSALAAKSGNIRSDAQLYPPPLPDARISVVYHGSVMMKN